MRALVEQGSRREVKMTSLQKPLGVSYERVAQCRRVYADIRHARTSVRENAARYLARLVLVLVLDGTVRLEQSVWPGADPLQTRLELERLRQHPFLGGFVPPRLECAEPAVNLFVAFLFHELNARSAGQATSSHCPSALHQLTVGQVHA